MSISVDALTFNIARVLTSSAMAGVAGGFAAVAADKLKIWQRLLWPFIAVVSLGAGIGSFIAGWASIKLSLLAGVCMLIVGGILMFDKDAPQQRALRRVGGFTLFALGAAWLAWNLYLMFR